MVKDTKKFVKNPNYYKDLKNQIADDLVNLVTSETAPWRKPWKAAPGMTALPSNAITGKSYNGMNTWLLWGKSESNLWATFKTWNKAGYSIIKGSKGTAIHYFEPVRKPIIEDGKIAKNKKGEDMYRMSFLFKTHYVFSAEQVQDKNKKPFTLPKVKVLEPKERIAKCEKFFKNLSASLLPSSDKCYYRPATDQIGMVSIDQFDTKEDYYSVLAHEHVHWTGADHRLKREKLNYAEEELVAEIGAFLTSVHLGIQSKPKANNLAYLKSWSQGDVSKSKIFAALSDASKSLEFMKEFNTEEAKKVA